jgi:ABC-type sugar transport system ATPase subunit
MNAPVVRMEKISKHFGGVEALQSVSFELNPREIVGLVGDNGAGKSTLIKILSGVHDPDAGRIYLEGEEVHIDSPSTAMRLGIQTIYQDLALVEQLTVSKNIFLGREPLRRGFGGLLGMYDQRAMESRAGNILESLGLRQEGAFLRQQVRRLSGGQRQAVAIGKTMITTPRILILDEPTAAISVKERPHVLSLARRLKEHGISSIFISHNLDEVMQVADRIVVLSRGRVAAEKATAETTSQQIARLIVEA